MLGLVATLIGSKTGRIAVVVGLTAITAFVVIWRVYAAGRKSGQAKSVQRTLEALTEKVRSDEAVRNMSAADRRKYVEQWVRD